MGQRQFHLLVFQQRMQMKLPLQVLMFPGTGVWSCAAITLPLTALTLDSVQGS